jgi:hypothetical protein
LPIATPIKKISTPSEINSQRRIRRTVFSNFLIRPSHGQQQSLAQQEAEEAAGVEAAVSVIEVTPCDISLPQIPE